MPLGRLHVLTDYYFQQKYTHAELAGLAIAGGADTIQFRDKQAGIRHKLRAAHQTAAVCRSHTIPLIIDDHLDLALAVGAAGLHLGQDDFPVAEARALLGDQITIGATATTLTQARRVQDEGASYIGFGPVFATRSKANPASVKGLDKLASVCAALDVPVIGIAGITVDRTRSVLEVGAYGIAVMSAISTAPNPTTATAAFRSAIDQFLTETAA